MTRTRWLPVAYVALAILCLRCGDSGGIRVHGTSTSAPSTAPAQPTTTGRPVNTSFTGQGSSAFCGLGKTFSDRFANFAVPSTPAQLRAAMQEGQRALTQATSAAPPEIAADFAVLAAGFNDLVAALEKVNYDAANLSAASFNRLTQPDFIDASQRFQAYLRNVCHTG